MKKNSGSSLASTELVSQDGTISYGTPLPAARQGHCMVTLQVYKVMILGASFPSTLRYKFLFTIIILEYPTLESGIDVGQGITVGPGKFVKKINVGPWISIGHEQNVQIYVTKNQLN